MKKIALIILVLAVLFLAGCGNSKSDSSADSQETNLQIEIPETFIKEPENGDKMANSEKTVEITSSGFSPSTLTINAGDSVVFINKDSKKHWPATDVHPTHEVYPGSDIGKCGSSEESEIFDACRGLEKGEVFTFTFQEKGEWPYHDHLKPITAGTIIVR